MRCRRHILLVYLFFIFLMTGCWEQKPTYLYLMVHPDYLQQSYRRCVQEAMSPTLQCEIIMRAQGDFTSLINQREQDPEGFGVKVLQEQANNISLKLKFTKVLSAYHELDKNSHDIEALKHARFELGKAKDEYQLSNEKVLILMSVIAATSAV